MTSLKNYQLDKIFYRNVGTHLKIIGALFPGQFLGTDIRELKKKHIFVKQIRYSVSDTTFM